MRDSNPAKSSSARAGSIEPRSRVASEPSASFPSPTHDPSPSYEVVSESSDSRNGLLYNVGIPLLLLLPEERVMTPEAYGLLRKGRDDGRLAEGEPVGLERCSKATRGSLLDDVSLLVNDLEAPVFSKLPRL